MAKLLEEWKEDLVEALTEHDLLLGSKHQKIEHAMLLVRNIAVGAALTAVRRGAGAGGMGSSGTLPLSQLSMLVGSSLSPFR